MASDAQLAMDIYGTASPIFYDDYDDAKIDAKVEAYHEQLEKHKVCPLLVRRRLSVMKYQYNIQKIIHVFSSWSYEEDEDDLS